MERSYATYQDIEVTPFALESIRELTIVQQINEHATLRLKGIVPEEQKAGYAGMDYARMNVAVVQRLEQGGKRTLFQGMVTNIQIYHVRDVYHIEMEAVSLSYQFDVTRKERTFQDTGLAYAQLVDQIVQDYDGADVMDEASNGAAIGRMILQYRETDWELLKRLASHFNTGLVPAIGFDSPKVHFGIPEPGFKGEVNAYHYRIHKRMELYQLSVQGQVPELSESDCIFYEVETDQVFDIGMEVAFDNQQLVVSEVRTDMKDGLLKHTYFLGTRLGLSRRKQYNMAIVGVSLQGKVIAVAKDRIQAHLNIDPEQDAGTAFWFPYSTIYASEDNAGWYCMPEIGDDVRVYFPTHKEEDVIAISSVPKPKAEPPSASGGQSVGMAGASSGGTASASGGGSDPMEDPSIKTIKTKNGKMIVLAPDHILITGDGVSIMLSDADGISIVSSKNVTVKATEEVMLASKKITITAQEKLEMTCKGSSVVLEDRVDVKGTQVHNN
ncbi:contractile injection system protein, VgrG/Pvc8 family [Paenibacillus durus]|uniref:Gp5/Type VI secretion system Vgr protein OB-fold domain-containing protein n=1 Tax=Paenibacillus durus ATCC 35681 TaxID=1333534 RepID=A0A0F7F8Q0_PAEDU|nr:contractile injection system protein, VgrG/Pvc8 family [Paenibacillus durus]AKG34792.1 hypothetical protein VK70_09600 [Paenibacillus durus ATCC 35681]